MKNPTVSVVVIAYNHEAFIEHTLKGIFIQKVDFPIEVIIANDCSPDKTKQVIDRLAIPTDKITFKVFHHTKNLGMSANFMFALSHCSGTYIAICEGDDYWTHRDKLTAQVALLEEDKEAVGCFHNSCCVDENNKVIRASYFTSPNDKSKFNQENCLFLLRSSYSTASLVFRSSAMAHFDEDFETVATDYVLDVMITASGYLVYMDKNWSAYRLHEGGIWQGSSRYKNHLATLQRYMYLYNHKDIGRVYEKQLWQLCITNYQQLIETAPEDILVKNWKKEYFQFLDFKSWRSLRSWIMWNKKRLKKKMKK